MKHTAYWREVTGYGSKEYVLPLSSEIVVKSIRFSVGLNQ